MFFDIFFLSLMELLLLFWLAERLSMLIQFKFIFQTVISLQEAFEAAMEGKIKINQMATKNEIWL